jgi:thioredoxin reductase (NADPH)
MTEAASYRGQHVFVVGGANSAGQAAMHFSRYASQVTMVVRGDNLNKAMSRYLVNQIESTANIDLRTSSSVSRAHGSERLEELDITNSKTGETETIPAAALFLLIGAKPHTEFLGDTVARNEAGFILTGPDIIQNGRRPEDWPLKRAPFMLETSVPGIFAVGDVREGVVRRVASAVGQGATAINLVHQYLKTV